MQDGVGIPKMDLDAIVIQQSVEEITRREGQAALCKLLELNNFIYMLIRSSIWSGCHWIISLGWRRPSSTSLKRSVSEHLLFHHKSTSRAASIDCFPIFFVGVILAYHLWGMSSFTPTRSGAYERSGGCVDLREKALATRLLKRGGGRQADLHLNLEMAATMK